jgi:hypothetical protein
MPAARGGRLGLLVALAVALASFGVAQNRPVNGLYPSRPGGMSWHLVPGRSVAADPWLEVNGVGARYEVDAAGIVTVSGEAARLYVRHPARDAAHQWRDVEVTAYVMRVQDEDVPYSGMTSVVRANHGVVGDLEQHPCDSRGLSARLRNDGYADFGKETAHPITAATGSRRVWPGGLPTGRWIGYKHVVMDVAGGVRQELWLDDGDGRWRMVASYEDRGGRWGMVPCAQGVDPTLPLDGRPERAGSESGLPNISVYFRADGVQLLLYRDLSVREITTVRR